MYRIFIDEVGHHNLKTVNDPRERYLALVGIITALQYAETTLTLSLNEIKQMVFGTTNVVLHRREIIDKKPAPFDRLADATVRERFDEAIIQLLRNADYVAITTLIDKKAHVEKYVVWQSQPYHYCLTAILERYVNWLEETKSIGDVLVESRGKSENKKLEEAYRHLYKFGTPNVSAEKFQKRLSSKEIKIKPKSENIAGLQVVDLIASPAARDLICRNTGEEMTAAFGKRVVEILYGFKYRRSFSGRVGGFGTKVLP